MTGVAYSWLGTKQRATSLGHTLLGDRLYNPATGLFTGTDPEPGGGDTTYGYPNDPINHTDLNGHNWYSHITKAIAVKDALVRVFVPNLVRRAIAAGNRRIVRGIGRGVAALDVKLGGKCSWSGNMRLYQTTAASVAHCDPEAGQQLGYIS